MFLNNDRLVEFFEHIDDELRCDIVLVAVDDTAMVLTGIKASTKNVWFTLPSKHYNEFVRAKKIVNPRFPVDVFQDGAVFINILPSDYLSRSKIVKTDFKNIELRVLHPVDLVITKISRRNHDVQDVQSCIRTHSITAQEIEDRAKDVNYFGGDAAFTDNLGALLAELGRWYGRTDASCSLPVQRE